MDKLFGAIYLPEDFDYKTEVEQAIKERYRALTGEVKVILTRNVKDFAKSAIKVQTPRQFLG